MAAPTPFDTMPPYSSTSRQLSPSQNPAMTNTEFQTRLPRAVRPTKTVSGMRSMPAGMEIRLRNTGTMRAKNTVLAPCRANHASALSISCAWTRGILSAIRRVRSRPSAAPAK